MTHYYDPDPLKARQSFRNSLALFEKVGDRWGLAQALAYLGWLAEHLGDYGESRVLCEKSLTIRTELGDRAGIADSMLKLGITSWVQGRLDEADALFQDSVGIFRSLDDWNGVAHAVKNIGEVQVRRGRFGDGLALMEGSASIYKDLGHKFGEEGMVPFLAEAKVHLGRYDEAHADARQGRDLALAAKHRWGVGFARFVEGLAALAQDKSEEALASLKESAAIFQEIRHPENEGWVLGPLGLAACQAGEIGLARDSVLHALQIGLKLDVLMPLLYGLPAATILLADQGEYDRALEVYACASRYPFVANSCWFEKLVRAPLQAMTASLPSEGVDRGREQGQARELADVARSIQSLLGSSRA